MVRFLQLLPVLALAAGCATRPAPPPAVASIPVPTPTATAAYIANPSLRLPAQLPDGGFATPNYAVSDAAALWHLRAGLNVAALACRGTDEAAIVAGYNALLAAHRTEFAGAYRAISTEYGTPAALDSAMTGLYNYYALPPAQPGLCAAALAVLSDGAAVPEGGLAQFTPAALARLDAPFLTVFRAEAAWRAAHGPVLTTTTQVAAVTPQLKLDPSVALGR